MKNSTKVSAEEQEKQSRKKQHKHAKRRRRSNSVLLVIAAVLLVFVLLVGGFVWRKLNMLHYAPQVETYVTMEGFDKDKAGVVTLDDEEDKPDSSKQPGLSDYDEKDMADVHSQIKEAHNGELMSDPKILNVLLIGVDSRDDSVETRSDSMILVSVNNRTKKIYMHSLMRDLYVLIPGYGYSKLNAANVFGGPQLLLDTVEENFRVEVDRYALVNLQSMAQIIDILGGVEIDVQPEELDHLNELISDFNRFSGEEYWDGYLDDYGYQLLNGKQAVSYARIRYVGNADYERTERQRRVLQALFEKARSADILQLNSMADAVLPHVTTNLEMSEVASLLAQAPSLLKYDVVSSRLPADGTFEEAYVSGMSCLVPDLDANIDELSESVYGYTYSVDEE